MLDRSDWMLNHQIFQVIQAQLGAYANPPWNLLGRALAKLQREQVEVVLMIAPVWPTQPWYPSLLGLLIDYPRLIPQGENTLWGTPQSPVPAVVPQLAVWPISSRDIAQRACHSICPRQSRWGSTPDYNTLNGRGC